MMSKLKKNKKIIIGLIAIVLCLGLFLFVKEKYIADTTTRLFHDNNQKMAAADVCKKIFDNGENSLIQFDVDDDESDEDIYYISCYVSQATLDTYKKPKGIKFNLSTNKFVKSISSNSIVCKPESSRVKVTVQDNGDDSGIENWLVSARIAADLKIDDKSYCEKGKNGSDLGPGGSGGQSNSVGGGTSDDVGKVQNPEEGESKASVDISDLYDEEEETTTAVDDAAAADSLIAGDENEVKSADKVQNNIRPWKNTATTGNKSNTSDYNTFTHMQKYELGWSGDTWTGKPSKTNLLSEKYGNHEVFPDDDSKTLDTSDYGARKNIIDTNIDWVDDGGTTKKGVINLACNYDLSTEQIKSIKDRNQIEAKLEDGSLTNYYYDQSNTTYFYGEQETTVPGGTLKYIAHTNGNKRSAYVYKKQTVMCVKKCQEIVKVEYGPPVYVNAGLCFEYRVKALSIVRCKTIATEGLNPPKLYNNKCSPAPVCWHGKSSSRQGGPNEEFENCVNSCDGGIYSKECSNKCYEAIYGDPQQALQDLAIRKMEARAQQLVTEESSNLHHANSSCPATVYGGHYYRSGKSVKYCQMSGQNNSCQGYSGSRNDAGLWYILNTYSVKQRSSSVYKSTTNGLIKACLGGGKICPDTCYWTKCKSDSSYLIFRYDTVAGSVGKHKCDLSHNYGTYTYVDKNKQTVTKPICTERDQMKADYVINKQRYRDAKKKCETKTVCTHSTATYTIGFKYSTGEKNVVVNFPYTGLDKFNSNKTGIKNEPTDDGITSILSYGGCYRSSAKENWYQTEWTFPGTYEDSKTHEKTYVKPASTNGYFTQKGLVCLPEELVDTNTAWGKKYYNLAYATDSETNPKVADEKNSTTVKSLRNGWKCTFKQKKSIEQYSDTTKVADGYNIKAASRDFGFFKWKFNIYCFYSLLNDPTKFDLNQNDPDNKCIKKEKYVAGTQIDTFNTSDPLLEGTSSRIQYRGANTAYNWKVTLTRMTEGGYDQDPQKLLASIKKDTNTFATPEFKFKLTADTIHKIKKYNRDNPLGSFEVNKSYDSYDKWEQPVSRNGVIYYRSYFLRTYMSDVKDKFLLTGDYDTYAAINNTRYPGGVKEVSE